MGMLARTRGSRTPANRLKWRMAMAAYPFCHRIILGLILMSFFSSACYVKGQSTGQMQRTLMDSYLVKSVKRFYPDGVPNDPAEVYPKLQGDRLRPIEEELRGLAAALGETHKPKLSAITAHFGSKVKEKRRANFTYLLRPLKEDQPDWVTALGIEAKFKEIVSSKTNLKWESGENFSLQKTFGEPLRVWYKAEKLKIEEPL
jgi:hypothetical protein